MKEKSKEQIQADLIADELKKLCETATVSFKFSGPENMKATWNPAYTDSWTNLTSGEQENDEYPGRWYWVESSMNC